VLDTGFASMLRRLVEGLQTKQQLSTVEVNWGSFRPGVEMRGSHLIVTVHGIRTFGQWQERLELLVKGNEPNEEIEFVNYKFGYFSVLAFIIVPFRWLVVRRFRADLVALWSAQSRDRVDLVGHSFGTHVIAKALEGLPRDCPIKIHTVILSGSVLRQKFHWRKLIGTRVNRISNDCGSKDFILLLSQIFILFTGMAGRLGFQGATGDSLRNRYSSFGHSGYFIDPEGRFTDVYMQANWLPLLTGTSPIAEFDKRPVRPWDGLVSVLCNNAEPFKIAMYSLLILALAMPVYRTFQEADLQRREALLFRSRLLSNRAVELTRSFEYDDAVNIALEAARSGPTYPDRQILPEAAESLHDAFRHYPLLKSLTGHNAEIKAAAFSQDGTRVASVSAVELKLWDGESGIEIMSIAVPGWDPFRTVAFSNDGRQFAAASDGGDAWIWSSDKGLLVTKLREKHDGPVWSIEYARFTNKILTASDDGTARIWNADNGNELQRLTILGSSVHRATFSPDEQFVATASDISESGIASPERNKGRIKLWNAESGIEVADIPTTSGLCDSVAFSPDGSFIAATDGTDILLYDIMTKTKLHSPKEFGETVTTMSFSPDSKYLAAASEEGRAFVWNIGTGDIREFPGRWISFSTDGERLVTATDSSATVWNVADGSKFDELKGQGGQVKTASYFADDRRIITVADDKFIRIWNSEGGQVFTKFNIFRPNTATGTATAIEFIDHGKKLVSIVSNSKRQLWQSDSGRALSRPTDFISGLTFSQALAFSYDGKQIIVDGFAGAAKLLDVRNAQELAIYPGPSSKSDIYGAALSMSGKWMTTWYADGSSRIWDMKSQALVVQLEKRKSGVWRAKFLPSDELLTAYADGTVRLTEPKHGTIVRESRADVPLLKAIDFSTDGRRIVSISGDSTVEIRQFGGASSIHSKSAGKNWFTSVAISGDGLLAAAATTTNSIEVWDAVTGQSQATLVGHRGHIRALKFSADGKTLYSGSDDNSVRIWDLASSNVKSVLRDHESGIVGIAIADDGLRFASVTEKNYVRIWRVFPSINDLTTAAKIVSPVCLSQSQREAQGITPEPPDWCITGPGLEQEVDTSKWQPKWPYAGDDWKRWLVSTRSGGNIPLPTSDQD
jgi:WD40 repeat protein